MFERVTYVTSNYISCVTSYNRLLNLNFPQAQLRFYRLGGRLSLPTYAGVRSNTPCETPSDPRTPGADAKCVCGRQASLIPHTTVFHGRNPRARCVTQGAINKARLEHRDGVRTGSRMDGVEHTPDGVLLRKMAAVSEKGKDGNHLPDRMAFSDDEVVRQAMR